jgi:hypothetical protein
VEVGPVASNGIFSLTGKDSTQFQPKQVISGLLLERRDYL